MSGMLPVQKQRFSRAPMQYLDAQVKCDVPSWKRAERHDAAESCCSVRER